MKQVQNLASIAFFMPRTISELELSRKSCKNNFRGFFKMSGIKKWNLYGVIIYVKKHTQNLPEMASFICKTISE